MKKTLLFSLLTAVTLSTPASAKVYYVKANATGDGSSWATASGDIDAMIEAAESGDEIWVASGTYKPTQLIRSNKKNSRAFTLKEGVSLYGGFAGTEVSKDDRQVLDKSYQFVNETIIDGDDDVADEWQRVFLDGTDYMYGFQVDNNEIPGTQNNSNHLFYTAETFTASTVIDGFTLKGGNANVWNVKAAGGALYASGNVQLNACKVIENSAYFTAESSTSADTNGGAVYLKGSGDASITNCYFAKNYSHSKYGSGNGGAVYATNVKISDCDFENNVSLDHGGALYALNSTVSNCTFANNYASSGGSVYSTGSLEDCVVYDSRALLGGGVYNFGTMKNVKVANCYADTEIYGSDLGGKGGGVYNKGGELNNVAVFNNTAFLGGGIYMDGGKLVNTTAANNALRSGDTGNVVFVNTTEAESAENSIIANDVETSNFVQPTSFVGVAKTAVDSAAVREAIWNVTASSSLQGLGYSEATVTPEEPADMVITFSDDMVGKEVTLGIGGTDPFQMDWGNGEKKDYTSATYYTEILASNQVKVYGDGIMILYANSQGVTDLTINNEPSLYMLQLNNNAIKNLDVSSLGILRGLYAANNGMESVKFGESTSSRAVVVDLNTNNLTGTVDVSKLNLSQIDLNDNQVDELLLPETSTLYKVSADNNNLTSLSVKNASGLNELSANGNKLTSLDLSGASSLEELYIGENELETLDLSDCTSLSTLTAYQNKISSIDLSKNTKLEGVYLYNNELTELDLTNNKSVRWLNVSDNKIAELNTTGMSSLSLLLANNNELSSIDLNNNKSLSQVKLGGNKLTEFPAIGASYLSALKLDNNQIKDIDLSNYAYLYWLELGNNQLSALDLSKNTYLQWLAAEDNELTELNLSSNKGVQGLTLQNNKMQADAINSVIDQLQDVSGVEITDNNRHFAKILDISNMPGTYGANVLTAEEKGWNVTATVPTAIENVAADSQKSANDAPIYNIAGQRVNKVEKGIYIVNGKKVVKK